MRTKRTYQQRIFTYFFCVFLIFTAAILTYQYISEKNYKKAQLENTLYNISETTANFIKKNNIEQTQSYNEVYKIIEILPISEIRVTVISKQGNVLFDNFISETNKLNNHLNRPEIQKAKYNKKGSNIRNSETTNQKFYYYAQNYETFYVRCAMVYNIELQQFLKASKSFLIFMLVMFIIMLVILKLIIAQLSDFITKLRDFSIKAGNGEKIITRPKFKDSEFGEIQYQITNIYNELKQAKDELSAEKKRLLNHLHALREGIAFFSPTRKKLLANGHFVQYTNLISEKSSISVESIFEIEELKPLFSELEKHTAKGVYINSKKLPTSKITINKNELFFNVQGIVFPDKSFEILIEDITRLEKRRLLKQQLTSNIAHELKTPLASIKGYLETIISNKNITPDKIYYFTERAFTQAQRLNELLNDISLLNNIEDASDLFEMKQVKLRPIINDVIENLESRIIKNNISISIDVPNNISVFGNNSLLTSIFQNFLENTINYAGKDISVKIKQYTEDPMYYYFSFSNNGKSIPETHLARIFERFYRIDYGRNSNNGGTGLGLSIVKNAINMHKGEISVRNLPNGGVVFLFSLAKN